MCVGLLVLVWVAVFLVFVCTRVAQSGFLFFACWVMLLGLVSCLPVLCIIYWVVVMVLCLDIVKSYLAILW